MRANVGGGWQITHLTDRVVELRKDSYEYRALLGRDGYVRVRIEPQETRQHALDRAVKIAQENDAKLAMQVAKGMKFDKAKLAEYSRKQLRMVPAFGTPEEPELIGVKGVR
jgi:hypothetical protein